MKKTVLTLCEKGYKPFSPWTTPSFPSSQFSCVTYLLLDILCISYLTCGEETKAQKKSVKMLTKIKRFIQIISVRYIQLGMHPPPSDYFAGEEAEPSMKSGKPTEF